VDSPFQEPTTVVFRCAAPLDARVYVAGSFNRWSNDKHALTHDAATGLVQTSVTLPPGRHEYKFVVDGAWMVDPNCPDWVINEHGSLNSVVIV
jgi:1,4-alpha-glucan branching enzyme